MNLTSQIAQLKTELREFIALSETITPGEWKIGIDPSCKHKVFGAIGRLADSIAGESNQSNTNATFIARSRNISPTMAKGWLMTLETLEYYDRHGQCGEGLINDLLKLWEETK